jgi:hypothetical protein
MSTLSWAALSVVLLGCAPSIVRSVPAVDFDLSDEPTNFAGSQGGRRVLGAGVDPRVPLHVEEAGDGFRITFARAVWTIAVTVDARTLEVRSTSASRRLKTIGGAGPWPEEQLMDMERTAFVLGDPVTVRAGGRTITAYFECSPRGVEVMVE